MMPVATSTMPFVLDDICNWEEVIKGPDLSIIDWETRANKMF